MNKTKEPSTEKIETFTRLSSRERILLSAKQLFSAQGYEDTSTTAIARMAGTSESQLIKHFGSKEGLLQAIFEEGWQKIHERADRIIKEPLPPAEKLRQVFHLVMSFIEKDRELRTLMLFEGRRLRREANRVTMSQGFLHYVARVDQLIRECAEAGQLRNGIQPEAFRSALLGALEGLSRDRLLAKRINFPARYNFESAEATINRILGCFLDSPPSRTES